MRIFLIMGCVIGLTILSGAAEAQNSPINPDTVRLLRALSGDAAQSCQSDQDCNDGFFCNGRETCLSGQCVSMGGACPAGAPCLETEDVCLVNYLDDFTDNDGDGVDSINDCDDGDAMRYPGNPEICDDAGRDEDCDLSTPRIPGASNDRDGDGFIDIQCFNLTDQALIPR